MLLDALGSARLHKVNVRHQDGDPRQDAENGHEVVEIFKHLARIVRHVEKGNAGNQRRQAEGINGHPAAIRARKDGEGIPLFGQAVQGSGGNVQVAVRGGEDEDEDAAVDQSRKSRDAAFDNGHHERRRRRTGFYFGGGEDQVRVVVRHQGSDQEHREDIKDENTPECQFDGSRDDFAWVLRLADGDAHQFGAIPVSLAA